MSINPMDQITQIGKHREYQWIDSFSHDWDTPNLVIRHHLGKRLCIVAFGGDPIGPDEQMLEEGWKLYGDVLVSPSLKESIEIPCEGYDEWYVTDQPVFDRIRPTPFVNFGDFSLRSGGAGPPISPDGGVLIGNPDLQRRFWKQIDLIKPISYICTGDNEIVVTRNRGFFDAVHAVVHQ